MEATCQRCHETLRNADRYCAVCGLPQLVYIASELPLVALVEGAERHAGGADPLSAVGGIAWRPALNAALLLAIPTSVLCFGFLPIGLLWMVAASAWAVSVYARRTRPASIPLGVGVRIGIVTGLMASWLTAGLYGAGFWVSRFVLHQGGEWDSLFTAQVERNNQQMLAQMGTANAESLQMVQSFRALMLSAEGRAGVGLGLMIFLAMFLIFFAILGGALGSRLQMQSRQPSA